MNSDIIVLDSKKGSVKDALRSLLTDRKSVNGDKVDLEQLDELMKRKQPEVVVMELSASKEDGLFLLERMTEQNLSENKPSYILIRNIDSTLKEMNLISNDPEALILEKLIMLGIPASIKGYRFIKTAILCAMEDRELLENMTQKLYPLVAEICGTTSARVERAIRHAIEVSWSRGDEQLLQKYFLYSINDRKGRPTNLEFIALLTDKISLELKNTLSNKA